LRRACATAVALIVLASCGDDEVDERGHLGEPVEATFSASRGGVAARISVAVRFSDYAFAPSTDDVDYAGWVLDGSLRVENEDDVSLDFTDRFTLLTYVAASDGCTDVPPEGWCMNDIVVTSTSGEALSVAPGADRSVAFVGWDAEGPHPLGFDRSTVRRTMARAAEGFGPDAVYVNAGGEDGGWDRACLVVATGDGSTGGPIAILDEAGNVLVDVDSGDPDRLCRDYLD
jgi:hypothetical protein